jgi:protein-disulfide isomerase
MSGRIPDDFIDAVLARTDIAEIMAYGVMSTPGVVVDGKVVHAGGLPGPDQARAWVRD